MSISTGSAASLEEADHDETDHDEVVCSLADVVTARGPLSEGQARAAAVAAAEALARLHDAGGVHGRLGPADLVLTGQGGLKLTDPAATTEPPPGPAAPAGAPEAGSASPEGDVIALAATIVALATGAVLDPTVPWPADFLWRLGCPLALGADAALVLDAADAVPTAADLGPIFGRGAEAGLALPEPVTPAVRSDPTPTMDYPPVKAPALPTRLR